ncbi:MAG: hypothetical protein LC732_03445 [Acidobacteria bacterium]|nr:hypothetical protein [Acidobacteriota bacterium]
MKSRRRGWTVAGAFQLRLEYLPDRPESRGWTVAGAFQLRREYRPDRSTPRLESRGHTCMHTGGVQ